MIDGVYNCSPFTYTLIRPIYVGMRTDQLILIVLSCFCDLYLWWSDWILERYLIIKGRCRLKKKNRFVVLITHNVNVAFFTSWQVLFCSSFNLLRILELLLSCVICPFCVLISAWQPDLQIEKNVLRMPRVTWLLTLIEAPEWNFFKYFLWNVLCFYLWKFGC